MDKTAPAVSVSLTFPFLYLQQLGHESAWRAPVLRPLGLSQQDRPGTGKGLERASRKTQRVRSDRGPHLNLKPWKVPNTVLRTLRLGGAVRGVRVCRQHSGLYSQPPKGYRGGVKWLEWACEFL